MASYSWVDKHNNKLDKVFMHDITNYFFYKSFDDAIQYYLETLMECPNQILIYTFKAKDLQNSNLLTIVNSAINRAVDLGVDRRKIRVCLNCKNTTYNFSKETWNQLYEIQKSLNKQGIVFGIEDERATWPLNMARYADSILKQISGDIKSYKLSPLETLMAAYIEVVDNEYRTEDKHNSGWSRSTIGLLNSNRIVCSGYVNYLKAICSYIGDENIKVFSNNTNYYSNRHTFTSAHKTAIIYIKDDKYNINGYYFFDPTSDALTDETITLNGFLISLKDIDKAQSKQMSAADTDYLISQSKDKVIDHMDRCEECSFDEDLSGDLTSIAGTSNITFEQDFVNCLIRDRHFVDLVKYQLQQELKKEKITKKEFCKFFDDDSHNALVYEYLQDTSKPIDLNNLMTATYKATSKMFKKVSKDYRSQFVNAMLMQSLVEAKYTFRRGATNCFAECEYFDGKKHKEITK